MKIMYIGDPHGDLEKVREIPLTGIDAIVLNGDLGKADIARKQKLTNISRTKQGLPEINYTPGERKEAFMESYNTGIELVKYLSKFAPVYTIYGNVENINSRELTDKLSQETGCKLPFLEEELNRLGVKTFNDKIIQLDKLRIGGIEYFTDTKENEVKAQEMLKEFGKLDLLVCHQPPYGVLDKLNNPGLPKELNGKNVGSKAILEYIQSNQPRYVCCGHVHEGEGEQNIDKTKVHNLGLGGYKLLEFKL
ncbi:MAG: metallophosphoesterase [Nanoarchaeota archaeon]